MYKLLNGDCLELMKDIQDESVDLVVTDCPYHIVQGGCSNNTVTFKAMSGVLNKQRSPHAINYATDYFVIYPNRMGCPLCFVKGGANG